MTLQYSTDTEHRWYAIQTTAGHENKVKKLLDQRIGMDPAAPDQRRIRQVMVPMQDVVEIKNGKKVTVQRKTFPGYVLVEMVVSQETLHAVNAIQGVIKFVGKDRDPMPLRQDEINRLLGIVDEQTSTKAPVEEIPFLVGQAVQIMEGPFTDFNGTVEEVMPDKGKVKVQVSLFGRPTSVELDYLQLKGY
jgi:transcription termination/antitermination protein NusG